MTRNVELYQIRPYYITAKAGAEAYTTRRLPRRNGQNMSWIHDHQEAVDSVEVRLVSERTCFKWRSSILVDPPENCALLVRWRGDR